MTAIKDSVHDHIQVDGVAADLIDTPTVQRLRAISQLGTASLVYPAANHSRFEHSLGVYHLACRALDHLGIAGRNAESVRAAALLHDVGHGPLSHTLEDLIATHTGKYHDDVADLLGTRKLGQTLAAHDLDPTAVAGLIEGDGRYGQLVSGELDVDRMDYLVRDAHHTGVPYGTIDHERLVRGLEYRDGALVLGDGNVQSAESLLVARALMTPVIYEHHVSRISREMLRVAAERLLDADAVTPEELRRMDDHEFRSTIRRHDASRSFGERFAERDLYKRAVWTEMTTVPGHVVDADVSTIRDLERDVAERANVDQDDVILDVPNPPSMVETTTRVVVNGTVRRLDEQSPIVDALRENRTAQWRLGAYTPAEHVDAVGAATEAVLGLEPVGGLVSPVDPDDRP